MNIWVTSDWHLGHAALLKFGWRKPGYGDEIVRRIIRAANPGDLLINLGDVAFGPEGKAAEISVLRELKLTGVTSVLATGNHDGSVSAAIERGWSFACQSFQLRMFGIDWWFSHEPMTMPEPTGKPGAKVINVHGHLHAEKHRGEALDDGHHVLISQEYLQCRPISLHTILEMGCTRPRWSGGKFQPLEIANLAVAMEGK